MEFIKKETEELTLIISYESSIAEKIIVNLVIK